jgi:uncharacterized membrane protein YgcG
VVSGGNEFDKWLEQQLQMEAAAQPGRHPMPAQAQYHAAYLQGGTQVSFLAKVAGLVTAKAAIGLTLGVLAVSAAGAAGEASITGSADPSNWGQQVVQQVQKCKAALAPGAHGIGDCVSAFAKQHGDQVSDSHQASGARTNEPSPSPDQKGNGKGKNKPNGNGNGNSNGNGNGNGNGHGNGNGNGNGHGNGSGNGNGNGNGNGG